MLFNYSVIKKNSFESVLMRWMKLEPIIQSDKESPLYRKIKTITVYKHIYMEFRKMVKITLYAKQKKRHVCIEQILDSVGEGEGGMFRENSIETCI